VSDEPLYGVYLRATGKPHPGADEIMAQMQLEWRHVVADLCAPPPRPRPIWYQKHMAHHLLPTMGRDWLDGFDNVLLIRDPARVVASYVQRHESVEPEDLGYAQQLEIAMRVEATTGETPVVLEAETLQRDPEGTLRRLCLHLNIEFEEAMLSWPPGPRSSDGVWAKHWYAGVEASTGFQPPRGTDPVLSPAYATVVEQVQPQYRELQRLVQV
jgi:hypothetical protein